jgi:excinuclease ABC subunit C
MEPEASPEIPHAADPADTDPAAEANPTAGAPSSGVDVIKDNLRRLPGKPGVYRMMNALGEVIYVGKAKNLKNRVGNYARMGGHTQRIATMIALTCSMEFVVTETETEALLLEANLIKRFMPRFNVLLRDDKSFPYILIRRDHTAPQILKYRGTRKGQGDYFGPFASVNAVERTLDTLQKAFLLRTCEDTVYEGRTRPCMLHQIKRCAAPCTGAVSEAEYAALADQASDFLRGKAVDLQDRLAKEMEAASDALDFETAARLRDRIRALAVVRASQTVHVEGLEEADVFAIALEGGVSCVQVFFYRAGQNWGTKAFYPRHERDATPEEVLSAFLVQFYDERPAPRLILTNLASESDELIAQALTLNAGHKVELRAPQRGDKRELVMQAENNAREALGRKLAETTTQARLLREVAKAFDLPAPPRRIEVYDNSHIQGTNAVGGMIVAGPEGFEKVSYRKFNIRGDALGTGDDYAMMREVMTRRFTRALKEGGAATPDSDTDTGELTQPEAPEPEQAETGRAASWPDLVLIDGGIGQLHATLEALAALGLGPSDVNLVSIAKGVDRDAGREQFFQPGRAPFRLPENSPVLHYLQRLRDEAHRWAIGAHRAKRSADIRKSPLDEIEGIGPARKKALLHRFGSARGVARARIADLTEVEGINQALAERIWGHFHGG